MKLLSLTLFASASIAVSVADISPYTTAHQPIAWLSPAVSPVDTGANAAFLKELGQAQPVLQAACFRGKITDPEALRKRTKEENGPYGKFTNASIKQPAPAGVDAARAWWTGLSSARRQYEVCEYSLWWYLLFGLSKVVESGRLLPAAEYYLEQVTDTTKISIMMAIASIADNDSLARRVAAAAQATGDRRRYDRIVANLGKDTHSQYLGYQNLLAQSLALLAHVYLAEGKTQQATRAFTRARSLVPTSDPMVGVKLALVAHDTARAVRELAFCRMKWACVWTDELETQNRQQLERFYRAINQGSLIGLDTVIAQSHARPEIRLPFPILRHPSVVGADRRRSIVQYETWIHCPPCAAHDMAAFGLSERFGDDVIVLAYHYTPPFTAPGFEYKTNGLRSWLKHMNSTTVPWVEGAPANCMGLILDGVCPHTTFFIGGFDAGAIYYDEMAPVVEQRLATAPGVHLTLTARREGDRIVAEAIVRPPHGVTALSADHPLKVHTVLVEHDIPVVGANRPFQDHLVRAIAGDSTRDYGSVLALPVAAGQSRTVRETFVLSTIETAIQQRMEREHGEEQQWIKQAAYHINRRNLSVVAYVQDQATGEVLQAARIRLAP